MASDELVRIGVDEARNAMEAALSRRGFATERAVLCARLFSEATLDGVYTHGLERFPRFVDYVERGLVKAQAEPRLVASFGAWERWDGGLGPGNLNALAAMDRAVTLARSGGLGCVALANTNHWMRGGQYGLRAADSGCVGICWTNTMPNLPAWGSKEALLGNNPLVIAVPREGGHVLLDMAMSQFSYGQLEAHARRDEDLAVAGGLDKGGRETRDAKAIMESKRPLPIGYWKGSGLSILLDLVGTILSGGDSVGEVAKRQTESGLSQVFLAFDLSRLPEDGAILAALSEMEERVHRGIPDEAGKTPRFPGEDRQRRRAENEAAGLPVRAALWEEILVLSGAGQHPMASKG